MNQRFFLLTSKTTSWSTRLNRWVEAFLFVIGLGMALLMGAQVFSRYVLNHSIFWSEEVGRMSLVWLSFLGASAAYKRHLHIGIDFLVRRFPAPLKRTIEIGIILISLIFFGILIIYGFSFARFVSAQKTAALGISQAIPYIALPLSGGLFFLHGLSHLLELMTGGLED
jgi:TRAP-type C4-dicarboxylate transport system permease small subunit